MIAKTAVLCATALMTLAGGATAQSGRIYFVADTDNSGDKWEIFAMTATGLDEAQVTEGSGIFPSFSPTAGVALSPDGSRIAVGVFRDGNTDIYVMDIDGGNEVRLTDDPGVDSEPSWSPDGTRIAFKSWRDGLLNRGEIYVMGADGSDPVRLTNEESRDEQPAWSPDGSGIAFVSNRDGRSAIFIMNADGGDPVNLTRDGDNSESNPVWSPDGSRIAYGTGTTFGRTRDLWVMDADGTNTIALAVDARDDLAPVWSPDGSLIAFTSNRDGNYAIYLTSAQGGGSATRLTFRGGTNIPVGWVPELGFTAVELISWGRVKGEFR